MKNIIVIFLFILVSPFLAGEDIELPEDYEALIRNKSELFLNGKHAKALKVALDEFEKKELPLKPYLITGESKGDSIEIHFLNKVALKKGLLGYSKDYPGITFLVSLESLEVTKFWYHR